MKKFALLIVLGLIIQTLTAQEEKVYKNSFRLGIVPIVRGAFQLNYERDFSKSSVVVIAEITELNVNDKKISGQMGELQYRFFISQNPGSELIGLSRDVFYMAPFAAYRLKNIKEDGFDSDINTLSYGLVFGFRYSNQDRIVLDFNLGAGMKHSDIETDNTYHDYDNNIFSPGYTGISPAGNITFGIKF